MLSLTETVSVPVGPFDHVLKTKDWSALDPKAVEYKYYAAGVGHVQTTVEGSSDQETLVTIMSETGA